MGYIDRTYQKKKVIDPRIWFFIAFVILFLLIAWNNCKGQYFNIDKINNACENIERIYITGYYHDNVHSVSWEVYFDSCNWNLISVNRNDVWIKGSYVEWVHPNKYMMSWFSLDPLEYSDTLLCFIFQRVGYIGGGEIEWSADPNACEIADFNGVAIPAVYNSGWLRCITSGIKEITQRRFSKGIKYNLLGQRVK